MKIGISSLMDENKYIYFLNGYSPPQDEKIN